MLTHKEIHANLNKCQAILEMRSPKNLKEAQWLAGLIASLSRFLPKIAEMAKLVMNLLKRQKISIRIFLCQHFDNHLVSD